MSNLNKEDEMLKAQFQESYRDIKLPEDFKGAVLSEMKKEAQKQEDGLKCENQSPAAAPKQNKQKKKLKVWQIGALGAVLCAAAVLLLVIRPGGASYVTPMEDGVYYDTVELKDGEIHFVKNRVAISITPNAGTVVIGTEDAEETGKDEKQTNQEERETAGGGVLLFQETSQLNLPEIAEESWSNIGKQQIYVTVLKTEDMRYQAVFEKDGVAYQVIGTAVTQKEFIDFLYEKVKE